MLCTGPDVCLAISLARRYQSNPGVTTGIDFFVVCHVFAVCQLTAKRIFAISFHKADGKERVDGKKAICRQLLLCRQPADGKELEGRRQRARWAPQGMAWLGQILYRPASEQQKR